MWDTTGTWRVLNVEAGTIRTEHSGIVYGTRALTVARDWHRTRGGDTYVMTPKGSAWLVEDNGYRKVGF